MIRCVLFDAAGTIIHVVEPVGVTYARIAAAHGIDVSAEAIGDAFRAAFAAAPPLAFPGVPAAEIAGRERAWWRELVVSAFGACGVRPDSRLERAFAAMFRHFASPHAWRTYDDVAPTADRLRAHGLRLAVVSNFDSRLAPVLEGLDLARRFDAVLASSRQGAAKPDASIFHAAVAACGATPSTALHVGDSITLDVDAARRAGLASIRIDRDGIADANTIVSLVDLPARIGIAR